MFGGEIGRFQNTSRTEAVSYMGGQLFVDNCHTHQLYLFWLVRFLHEIWDCHIISSLVGWKLCAAGAEREKISAISTKIVKSGANFGQKIWIDFAGAALICLVGNILLYVGIQDSDICYGWSGVAQMQEKKRKCISKWLVRSVAHVSKCQYPGGQLIF